MRNGLLLAVCLLWATQASVTTGCNQAAWLDELGPNPLTPLRGKVVLVALLKGYCGYCVRQSERMSTLKVQLAQEGFTDIEMLIINGGDQRARDNIDNLLNATSIPVLQDREDEVMYNHVFIGRKDDFIIYDRCGQRSYFIYSPFSDLEFFNYTRNLLKKTHRGQHRCYCSLDRPVVNMDDVMVGDDPTVSSLSMSNSSPADIRDNSSSSDESFACPPGNRICRRMMRALLRRRMRNNARTSSVGLPNFYSSNLLNRGGLDLFSGAFGSDQRAPLRQRLFGRRRLGGQGRRRFRTRANVRRRLGFPGRGSSRLSSLASRFRNYLNRRNRGYLSSNSNELRSNTLNTM